MPFKPHLKNALLKRGGDLSESNETVSFRNGDKIISFKGTGRGLPQEEISVVVNGEELDLSQYLNPETPILKTGKNVVKNIHGTYVDCISICDNILEKLGFIESGKYKKYGKRKVASPSVTIKEGALNVIPEGYDALIKNIKLLSKDHEHKERAHESLVQEFYELLGYKRFEEIKYQIGRIDVSLELNKKTLVVTEVKKNWKLSKDHQEVVDQAYNYANEVGALIVVITNGNYYAIFNRIDGHSYDDNFIGEFILTELTQGKLKLVNWLKKENILSFVNF